MCIIKHCDKSDYELEFCEQHWNHYYGCFKEYLARHGVISVTYQTTMPPQQSTRGWYKRDPKPRKIKIMAPKSITDKSIALQARLDALRK